MSLCICFFCIFVSAFCISLLRSAFVANKRTHIVFDKSAGLWDKPVKILGSYRVDWSAISVSGMSSGGGMTTQMHVAYSSVFVGVGIISGSKHTVFTLMTCWPVCD